MGYMYRYEDNDDRFGPAIFVLRRFPILRRTPCGVWVNTGWGSKPKEKWVANEGKNNYAKPTKEAALENYYHRKRYQVDILERKLARAKQRLELAEREIRKESDLS